MTTVTRAGVEYRITQDPDTGQQFVYAGGREAHPPQPRPRHRAKHCARPRSGMAGVMSAWPDTLAADYVVTFNAVAPALRRMTLVEARDLALRYPKGSRPRIIRASTGEVYQQEVPS